MDFSGEYRVPAPRARVWEALNDPSILRVCIDGCEDLEWVGEGTLRAVVRAKIGPVSARFVGDLTLSDVDPGRSYVLLAQGQGGAAGFAKGSARVDLLEDSDETVLRYHAQSQVGGKLASVAQQVVQGVANRTAEQFFERFTQRLRVALRAEAEGRDLDLTEADVFEVLPVELPEDYLVALDTEYATPADGPSPDGEPGPGDLVGGRPVYPLAGARMVIVLAGFGLFLMILSLLFLSG